MLRVHVAAVRFHVWDVVHIRDKAVVAPHMFQLPSVGGASFEPISLLYCHGNRP